MTHAFLEAVAKGLAERGVATLRFQFPYMEERSRRPDRPEIAYETVRAAVLAASRLVPGLPLIAGGKSFGGRMTSQAQTESPLPGVRGLAFLGFPLHPAGRPSVERAKHLANVGIPMLFFQGTRDALADTDLIRGVVRSLGSSATLTLVQQADHSFHVPVRSGRKDSDVLEQLLDRFVGWLNGFVLADRRSATPSLSSTL